MTEYAVGTPMWIDFASPDIEKSRAFYEALFGWDKEVFPDAGGYTIFRLNGKMVAGGGPTFSPEQHPAWMQYVKSEDADATAQKIKDAGGEVVMDPMDVPDQGRMAIFSDSAGAHCGIWQPKAHQGAEMVNEPGSFSWSELYTRDIPKALEFAHKVFGWTSEETEMAGLGKYYILKVNDRAIAGALDMSSMLPAEVPPHWLSYFTVTNTDETLAKVKELGGEVVDGPNPTPMGPMGVLRDPVGAHFAVIQINQKPQQA